MEGQTEHAGCTRTGIPFLRALALLPLLLLVVVALLVAFAAAAFLALLLLPPPLPPLLILAMPSQLPVAMLIIPAAFVAASAGAAVAVPSPSPSVSLAIALIPRRSFSPQACYGASHCALHNEWGQNGPPTWE